MKEIQEFDGLQALRLEGNTIGVEAAQAIAKALETKSELKVWIVFVDSHFEYCVHHLFDTLARIFLVSLLDECQLFFNMSEHNEKYQNFPDLQADVNKSLYLSNRMGCKKKSIHLSIAVLFFVILY